MNKFIISALTLLFSSIFIVPSAIAQMEEPDDTRIEKYEDLTETDADTTSQFEVEDSEDMENMEDMNPMDSEDGDLELETRTEETLEDAGGDFDYSSYDVRRTEAFNLVSSAYRGDFEDQGVESYAVLITNYETGDLTAEDLVQAAVEAGELSPTALEDQSYIEAVDAQLGALTTS